MTARRDHCENVNVVYQGYDGADLRHNPSRHPLTGMIIRLQRGCRSLTDPGALIVGRRCVSLAEVVFDAAWDGDQQQPGSRACGREDAQRAFVADSRLAEVASVVFGVAEAVPDVGLEVTAAIAGVEGEGLPAEPTCLRVVPQVCVLPADRVEQFGFARLVADVAAQAGGLLGVAQCISVLPLILGEHG